MIRKKFQIRLIAIVYSLSSSERVKERNVTILYPIFRRFNSFMCISVLSILGNVAVGNRTLQRVRPGVLR